VCVPLCSVVVVTLVFCFLMEREVSNQEQQNNTIVFGHVSNSNLEEMLALVESSSSVVVKF